MILYPEQTAPLQLQNRLQGSRKLFKSMGRSQKSDASRSKSLAKQQLSGSTMSVAKMKIQLQKALQSHDNGKNLKKVSSMANHRPNV